MKRRNPSIWLLLSMLVVAVLVGCGASAGPAPAEPVPVVDVAGDEGALVAASNGKDGGSWGGTPPQPGPIPVTETDATWGEPVAPVTIVAFFDFECPYCGKAVETLDRLRADYGPNRLRIAYKHNPLPFHKNARPAADVSQAIYQLQGAEAFWQAHDTIFKGSRKLDEAMISELVRRSGLREDDLAFAMKNGARRKVDDDMALAAELGARGTPAFFINGIFLSGAQPIDRFKDIIDPELREAEVALGRGIPVTEIYAARTAENLANAEPADPPPSAAPSVDTTVYFVPVGKSPIRGPADALVTIVMFSDFQCPFCAKVVPTLEQIQRTYGNDVRLVFKHQPLPFHKRAGPASQLAIEAFNRRGHNGFWEAHDALFKQQKNLEDADLEALAGQLKLNPVLAMQAVRQEKHQAVIDDDQDLARDIKASGTPAFFINGRRLSGAQPFPEFASLIDEQLAAAKQLQTKGIPKAKVYAEIMKGAQRPAPPKSVSVPRPTKANPSRGPANAPVVIQMFSEFQCPFCGRVTPTMADLQKEFPREVRIVWRNLPLAFHKDAEIAATAAMEAHRQKGDAAFWKMHDLLFANQKDLSRTALDGHARALGLNMAQFAHALDTNAHAQTIEADKKVADKADLTGTPSFVINDYVLVGAQPLSAFRKLVEQAIKDAKTGKKVP